MKRIISIFLATLMLSAAIFSMTGCTSLKSSKKEATVVMTVGGIDVTYEVYRYFAMNLRYEIDGGDKSFWESAENKDELLAELEQKINDAILTTYAIFACGNAYGATEDDPAIADVIKVKVDQFVGNYDSKSDYVKDIKNYYMNHAVVKLMISSEIIEEELYYGLQNAGKISTDETYLNNYFRSDDFIRAKQVLIAFDADGDGYDDGDHEAKYALAETVLAKARAGEDFDSLVQKYGNDLMMFNNTDGYYFMRGVYVEEFENAAFDLDIGEISDIVETSEGYSIILRCEKEESYIKSHTDELTETYGRGKFNQILSDYKSELEISKTDNFAKLCDLVTME